MHTIQAINGPKYNRHKRRCKITRAATYLFSIQLISMNRTTRFIRTQFNKTRRFQRAFTYNLTPSFRCKCNYTFSGSDIPHSQRRIRPSRNYKRITINSNLTLHSNACQLIRIRTKVPSQVPRFINRLIRLLINRHIQLMSSRRVGIKTKTRLSAYRQASHTRASTNYQGVRKGHLTNFIPRLYRVTRNRFHTNFTFHHTVTMSTINIKLTRNRRPLFRAVSY